MRALLKSLLAIYLVGLLGSGASAETPRFARGFVIYKKVPSDQPVHYGGTLFLSSNPGPVWQEYDVGQPKPFFLAKDLFVNEIKFGALFEADFTTDKHVEYCKAIQAQLSAAAKQSPQLASAANASVKAIQAEVDHYEKDMVRLQGSWITREKYATILAAAEKAKLDKIAARKAEDAEISASRAKMAAKAELLQDHLTHNYNSYSAHYLVAQSNFSRFVTAAVTAARSGAVLPVEIPRDSPDLIALPEFRDSTPLLLIGDKGDPPLESALLCSFNDRSQMVAVDLAFFFIFKNADQTLVNWAELERMKKTLDKFNWQIFDSLPDVLAATRIKATLRDKVAGTGLASTRMTLPQYSIEYSVDEPTPYGKTEQQQFVLIQIRPAP
jgi:hypothetical protein